MPILPMVLVNGAEGIGTGWSTSIPNYNPMDLVNNLKRMLEGQEPVAMEPWYLGFKGSIQEVPQRVPAASKSFQVAGVVAQLDDSTLEISELPVRKWTQDYKEFLEEMVKPEDKNAQPFITGMFFSYALAADFCFGLKWLLKECVCLLYIYTNSRLYVFISYPDYKEHHTDATVKFVVSLPESKMKEALANGLYTKFKLTSKVSTSNMMLFDSQGRIKKYDTPEDILKEFFHLRMDFYVKRKAALLKVGFEFLFLYL